MWNLGFGVGGSGFLVVGFRVFGCGSRAEGSGLGFELGLWGLGLPWSQEIYFSPLPSLLLSLRMQIPAAMGLRFSFFLWFVHPSLTLGSEVAKPKSLSPELLKSLTLTSYTLSP